MYGLIPTVGLITLFTGKVTLVPMQYRAGTSIKKKDILNISPNFQH